MMEPCHILDVFRDYLLFESHIKSENPELYLHHSRQNALKWVERDLWQAMNGDAFDPLHSKVEIMYFSHAEIRVMKRSSVSWKTKSSTMRFLYVCPFSGTS